MRPAQVHSRLPTFLVIGAMKAGTTSLYHYLSQHPQILMSRDKEPDFFAQEINWRKGWSWYERQFSQEKPGITAIGEASTTYTKYPVHPGVAGRIAEHLPDVRLIYVIRDPIERIRSHYLHRVSIGMEDQPIDIAVLQEPMYLNYSRYAMQIAQYLEYFERNRLLVVTSEALREQRQVTVARVYDFIEVTSNWVAPNLHKSYFAGEQRRTYPALIQRLRHSRELNRLSHLIPERLKQAVGRPIDRTHHSGSGSIPQPVRTQLEHLLRDDVSHLRRYLGRDFDGWGIA